MKFYILLTGIFLTFYSSLCATETVKAVEKGKTTQKELPPIEKKGAVTVRIGQLRSSDAMRSSYPAALRSLLASIDEETSIKMDKDPRVFDSFEDDAIFECSFIYVNYSDRTNWEFTKKEVKNLRRYLENGGFIYIDAGINSEFLRGNSSAGQHHSFADWEVTPSIAKAFKQVFAGKKFKALPRSHKVYRMFYKGLPDASVLPDSVREFVVNEKWPQGTYSAVALEVKGRLAVMCTPIVAMGWGKRYDSQWETQISFRIRESTDGLGDYLKNAAHYSNYKASREDGAKDVIYTDSQNRPAWVKEPDGTWRVFRYYSTQTISDYAHEFYTRLGTNIFMYGLSH